MKVVLSALFLLALLSACAPQAVTVPAPVLGEEPYINPEENFSMRYPQGWLVEDGDAQGVVTFLDNRVKPTHDSLPAFPIAVVVLSAPRAQLDLPAGKLTDPAVMPLVLRRLGVGMKTEVVEPQEIMLNGRPALRLDVKGTLNVGTELAGRIVALEVGDTIWAAFALASLSEWSGFAPTFEQMLASVAFK